jgi:proteic killer suppression protein
LQILDSATSLTDLAELPSNRLEALRGDRDGQYSIRITLILDSRVVAFEDRVY